MAQVVPTASDCPAADSGTVQDRLDAASGLCDHPGMPIVERLHGDVRLSLPCA